MAARRKLFFLGQDLDALERGGSGPAPGLGGGTAAASQQGKGQRTAQQGRAEQEDGLVSHRLLNPGVGKVLDVQGQMLADLLQKTGFQLAHAFAGHVISFTDLAQGDGVICQQPVLQDIEFLLVELGQDALELFAQQLRHFGIPQTVLDARSQGRKEVHAGGTARIFPPPGR